MLIGKSYLELAMPVSLENSSIESEIMSLSIKISLLLCIGELGRAKSVSSSLQRVYRRPGLYLLI